MPHPKILEALGMTKEQWGSLPPETISPARNDLKKKAMGIIAEKEGKSKGLHDRVANLESRVSSLEKQRIPPPPPAATGGEGGKS